MTLLKFDRPSNARHFNKSFKILALAFITIFCASFAQISTPAQAVTVLNDIGGHWAEESIQSLAKVGIIDGYPDGSFRPEDNITRAEFAKIVARAFGYAPKDQTNFTDMGDHWAKHFVSTLAESQIVTGYPDGSFQPSKNITRAEMVAMLARVAKLGDIGEADATSWTSSFTDVNSGHWAFRFVEIAHKLDIIPIHFGLVFQPEKAATRAETAYMVAELRSAQFAKGTISEVNFDGSSITLTSASGDSQNVRIGSDVIIYRNDVLTSADKLQKNDELLVIGTSYGSPRFVIAKGTITREDITNKVSSLTNGLLTPEQVDMISKGEWQEVTDDLKPSLNAQMQNLGLTSEEADAILNQKWDTLPELGKERLSKAISKEIGISSDLVSSLMDRDWEKAKVYAQLDAAQIILNTLMKL